VSDLRIAHRRLEALSPGEWAAHGVRLAELEAAGWRFRPGSSPHTVVGERGGHRVFGRSLAAVLAQIDKYRSDLAPSDRGAIHRPERTLNHGSDR
jgi:hypothetical protein